MPILALAAAFIAAVVLVGPQLVDGGLRKITFRATVGDGKTWAGGFRLVYTVGNDAQTVTVLPLPRTDPRKNKTQVTKVVPVGTSVTAKRGQHVILSGTASNADPLSCSISGPQGLLVTGSNRCEILSLP